MEPATNADAPETSKQQLSLRFALVALIVGLSYPNVRCALAISVFQQVYKDMLGDKPLPPVTVFMIHARVALIALSFAIPALAVLSLFVRRLSASTYLAGVLIILIFVQLFSTWHAAIYPLITIVTGMSETGAGH
jgi:hypothetical protein